jgi:predicted acetyltransferase
MTVRTFRSATEGDLDRLIEIHMAAYPDPRSYDARRRNFVYNSLGSLSDLAVCLEDGKIVGHGFLFSLSIWSRGQKWPFGGIASLGVAPEARKTGVAHDLMTHLHEISEARGDVATLLYPFRHGFYERLGYAAVTPSERLIFSPRAIPCSIDPGTSGTKNISTSVASQ